ncbi:leukocyte elastase inhibitor-like isoform X2 [Limulus polyphemus]|uniref:Leukocyte elastase inhibitor-like isoform X2 n=1 Tax=Limulus polyphemus TaxID=6850 RepID=A0ABM1TA37_LIMPO|nr:leukocyte elastase inhibitor-like isoform X2 [Limulus polyphemus]
MNKKEMEISTFKICFVSALQFIFFAECCFGNSLFDNYLESSIQNVQQENGASKIANATNYFGFGLYNKLQGNDNVLISPYTMASVMAMLYLGSRGITEREMSTALGYNMLELSPDDIVLGFQQLINILNTNSNDYTLKTASALLVQDSFHILDEYKQHLERNFGVEAQEVDFVNRPEKVKQAINKWVAQKTRNNIPILLDDPLKPNTRLFFLNAVYFKGLWKSKFDSENSNVLPFFNNGITRTNVVMMYMTSEFPFAYVPNLKSFALEMPYQGNKINMLLLLPRSRTGLSELENTLSSSSLNYIDSLLRKMEVDVLIPKFTLKETYTNTLKRSLVDMGINHLFGHANLTGMVSEGNLYVSDVFHKTFIQVDEEGTAAAAVGGASVVGYSASSPRFYANHPFIFFIRHAETGVVLFMGKVATL